MKKLLLVFVIAALMLASCGGGTEPKPGATFTGPIRIGNDKASSATIRFTISEDGSTIKSVGVTLNNVKCGGMTAGTLSVSSGGDFKFSGGGLNISPSNIGVIKGRFTSPTEASGTVHLALKLDVMGSTISCELGTWNWGAEAP